MNKWQKTAFAFGLALALGMGAFGAYRASSMPKIGIVDNAVLLQQFSEAIRAREEIQAERKQWQENSKKIEDSLQAVMASLTEAEKPGSKIDRKALSERLHKWNKEYTDYSEVVRQMGPKVEAAKLKPVLEKVNMFITNWGAANGFDAIYGTGTGGVILMRNPNLDVTASVLKDLNALYFQEQPGTKLNATRDSTGGKGQDAGAK